MGRESEAAPPPHWDLYTVGIVLAMKLQVGPARLAGRDLLPTGPLPSYGEGLGAALPIPVSCNPASLARCIINER
ncbi:unnamed protein product [Merluccius merluccius]